MLLRCVIRRKGEVYQGVCLEFGLHAEGSTPNECRDRLEEAVLAYIEAIREGPPDVPVHVRPVPFYRWKRLVWDWRVNSIRRKRDRGDGMAFHLNPKVPGSLVGVG